MNNRLNLKDEFINNINFEELNKYVSDKPIVIGFIASIGAGKSTIAKLLSQRLPLPIMDNDGIRRFLNNNGYSEDDPPQALVMNIAYTRRDILLKKKISYIIDADVTLTYKNDKKEISSLGGELLLIQIICPEKLILERLAKRKSTETNSLADQKRYFEREKYRQKVKVNPRDIFFEIDSSKNINPQINNLTNKLSDKIKKPTLR